MSLSFKIKKEHLSNGSTVAIACLSGFIDIRTVKIFEEESLKLLREGNKYLILNFTNVGYMNSTGLGILVKVQDKYKDADGDVILVDVPLKIYDLFKMLGMDTILKIKGKDEEALASLPFPLLPQIPDIPDMDMNMDMNMDKDDGDENDFSAPPLNMSENGFGGDMFLSPDSQTSNPIVISGSENESNFSEPKLDFPTPSFEGNLDFGGFEISGSEENLGEATSIDISNDKDNTSSNEDSNTKNEPKQNIIKGVETTKAFHDLGGLKEKISNIENEKGSLTNILDKKTKFLKDEDEYDDEDDMAISELDLTAEDDFDEDSNQNIPVISSPKTEAEQYQENQNQQIDTLDDILDSSSNKKSDTDDIFSDESESEIAAENTFTENKELEKEHLITDEEEKENLNTSSEIDDLFSGDLNTENEDIDIDTTDDLFSEDLNKEDLGAKTSDDLFSEDLNKEDLGAKTSDDLFSGDLNTENEDIEIDATDDLFPDLNAKNRENTTNKPSEIASAAFSSDISQKKLHTTGQENKQQNPSLVDRQKTPVPQSGSNFPVVPSSPPTNNMNNVIAPKLSEAPSAPIQKQEQKKQSITRKTTVRYYEKMNPLYSFPLTVAFSKEKLKSSSRKNITQVQGESISVSISQPEVIVTPHLKGCHIYPPCAQVNISPDIISTEFWITPIIEGQLNGYIEIKYDDKVVQKISIEAESLKQTWAKISAFGAIFIPVVSFILEGLSWDLQKTAWNLIPKFLTKIEASIGLSNFGIVIGATLIAAGAYFYTKNKPTEAEKLQEIFST